MRQLFPCLFPWDSVRTNSRPNSPLSESPTLHTSPSFSCHPSGAAALFPILSSPSLLGMRDNESLTLPKYTRILPGVNPSARYSAERSSTQRYLPICMYKNTAQALTKKGHITVMQNTQQ